MRSIASNMPELQSGLRVISGMKVHRFHMFYFKDIRDHDEAGHFAYVPCLAYYNDVVPGPGGVCVAWTSDSPFA